MTLVVAAALLAPWVSPHDPLTGDLRGAYLISPGSRFWLGTDTQGRDVLSRVLYGARLSLSVGLISQSVSVTIGVLLGLLAGYYGRWVDALVMRLADITLAFPTPPLFDRRSCCGEALASAGVRGDRSRRVGRDGAIGYGARCWCFVDPSSWLPPRRWGLVTRGSLRHLLPNVRTQVIIAATLGIAGAIMAEAALSFVGPGAQPSVPKLGGDGGRRG